MDGRGTKVKARTPIKRPSHFMAQGRDGGGDRREKGQICRHIWEHDVEHLLKGCRGQWKVGSKKNS